MDFNYKQVLLLDFLNIKREKEIFIYERAVLLYTRLVCLYAW